MIFFVPGQRTPFCLIRNVPAEFCRVLKDESHSLQNPTECHAIPESEAQEGPKTEAVYTLEESFEQERCASLIQVTELTCVKDEEVPQQEYVSIKEELIEQECVPIAEEVPTENNIYTFEKNNKLGSNLCDDRPSECELGFRASIVDEGEHDSTPSPHCKNSSNGKPQHKKHRETTNEEENVKKLKTHSVKIPSLQDRQPLTVESTETPHSVWFNNSETQGSLKTLPHSVTGVKSFCQLGSLKTHKGNHTGGTPLLCAVCGKSFKHLSKLEIHQRVHTGEKPYHCTQCGKRFSQLHDLKRHQRVHTGEKPYHCTVCGKSFTRLGNLQTHRRIHTEEKPYRCPVLWEEFLFFNKP